MASRQLTSNLKRLGTFIFCVLTWGSGLTQQVPLSARPSGAACPAASEVHKGQTKVDPQYEVIATGLLGSPVVPFQFKSASLRLEIRNLVMGNPSAETAPMPARTIFEVRGGTLI